MHLYHRSPPRTGLTLALGALALAASACGSTDGGQPEPGAASESAAHDTAALSAGATWLSSQVTDGAVHNDQYDIDDYGLSIDVALALHAVDEQPDTVRAVGDRLAEHVDEYTSPGFGTLTSAGGTAKSVVLAQAVGADVTAYGGTNLLVRLEETVADKGPARGRVQDALDPKQADAVDYANVVGQAYAVTALGAADSAEAPAATDFLLAQQCEEGWFRLDFTKDDRSTDQSCDGDRTGRPDLDATAFAVRALVADDSSTATAAVDSAVAWLETQQAADGSFGGGEASTTANSNSTGLAGAVLGEAGETTAAEQAATWVFRHQALDCQQYDAPDVGAVAYDDASLEAAAKKGITVKSADQFRRASAGALPVLQWLPDNATQGQKVGSC